LAAARRCHQHHDKAGDTRQRAAGVEGQVGEGEESVGADFDVPLDVPAQATVVMMVPRSTTQARPSRDADFGMGDAGSELLSAAAGRGRWPRRVLGGMSMSGRSSRVMPAVRSNRCRWRFDRCWFVSRRPKRQHEVIDTVGGEWISAAATGRSSSAGLLGAIATAPAEVRGYRGVAGPSAA